MAGQGTLGLEIVEQVPDIDAVVVPIGGGGLIAGVALAVKTLHPNVMIIVSHQRFEKKKKRRKQIFPDFIHQRHVPSPIFSGR